MKSAKRKKSAGRKTKAVRSRTGSRKKTVSRSRAAGRRKGATRSRSSRPRLELVKGTGGRRATGRRLSPRSRRAARSRAAATAFKQTAGATSKQMIMFRLARGRTSLLAAVQGLVPGSAERAMGQGKWNVKQVVLHLIGWDQEVARAVEQAVLGGEPEWMRTSAVHDRMNAEAVARLGHLTWDAALRLLHASRQELLEAIETIPEDPVDQWGNDHPLGRLLHWIPPHDLHHADAVKRWRAEEGI